MQYVKAGDILLYGHAPNFETRMIQFGEILEDGIQDQEFYHVAIALNALNKIEANGKYVEINPIDYGKFSIFRPPIDQLNIKKGLDESCQLVGEPYDWLLIFDDVLRYLTHNFIHLPEKWINLQERHKKICSSLVAFYFRKAGWHDSKDQPNPEDIYLMVKNWRIG